MGWMDGRMGQWMNVGQDLRSGEERGLYYRRQGAQDLLR